MMLSRCIRVYVMRYRKSNFLFKTFGHRVRVRVRNISRFFAIFLPESLLYSFNDYLI